MSAPTRYLGLDFRRYRWIVLVSVFVVNFTIVGIAWYYPLMLVDALLEDLPTDLSGWGLLWGGISMGALLSSFPAGVLADRLGVRSVVAFALLLGGGALILRAEFAGFSSALVSMFLFGITAGVLVVVLPKTLGLWFGRENLGFANGFAQAGLGVSFTVTGFATIPMVQFFGGWREFSFAFGWFALGLAALWWLVIRDPERPPSHSSEPSVLFSLGLTLRVRDVWVMALCYLLYSAGYFGASGYIPVFLGDEWLAGLWVAVVSFAFAIGALTTPGYTDRIGRRKWLYIIGMAVGGVSISAHAFAADSLWLLMTSCVVWGIFTGGAVTMVFTMPQEMDPPGPALSGTSIGVIIAMGFVGGWVGPMIGMELASRSSMIGILFFGICLVASAVLFLFVRETGWAARRDSEESGNTT